MPGVNKEAKDKKLDLKDCRTMGNMSTVANMEPFGKETTEVQHKE
jgi:hypothetical protein